jgi:cyclophilin family peptidyl-prolyl cis-trans isomerase
MLPRRFPPPVPLSRTAENFRCLCTGERGGVLTLRGSLIHRVVPGFVLQVRGAHPVLACSPLLLLLPMP